jgi:hypothetical protein
MKNKKHNFMCLLIVAVAMMSLWACGGGGGDSAPSSATSTTTIAGSVFASAVSGANVSAKNVNGQTIAGPVISAADGTFSINIPTSSLASDLLIETDNGTFADEASARPTTAGKMAAYIKGGSLKAASTVNITPTSTIIHDLVTKYGLTPDNAGTTFNSAFGYLDDVSITPNNTPLTTTDTDTQSRLAFLHAAAFSQLTKDLSLTPDKQFDLLAAIAQDLADGVLDGKDNNVPVTVNSVSLDDIQCRFANALAAVQNDSTTNKTGITADKIGNLPFGKTELTNTYKIQYVPGMMAAVAGKTSFKLKITKRSDGSAATGLTITLMPKMHMATMSHSAPVDVVTEDSSNPGNYNCTVYYLMASGPGMGYWELKTSIGSGMTGESATFYPTVGMATGSTTARATLKGINDKIAGSMGAAASPRTYYLFNDGGTTSTSFKLFIAAQESMMSYPPVFAGATLHDATNTAWTINSLTVQVSVDEATWVLANPVIGGHWMVSGLTGLSVGQSGTIYVKLTINNEQKTTDGNAPASANGYATFTVTP